MLQTLAMRVLSNPAVIEGFEILAVGALLGGIQKLNREYVDKAARRRAEQIVKAMNNRR